MTRFNKYINEMISPQMSKKLKKLTVDLTAIRNQMKQDGLDKEADQMWLQATGVISSINKSYKNNLTWGKGY